MRQWRLKRGMRVEDLAKAVGKSKGLISRYERGLVGISLNLWLKVLEALRIRPDEFFVPPPEGPDTEATLRERSIFWKKASDP